MQEGVHCLVPYMTKQRLFLSTSDILDLLRRQVMPSSAFKSLAFRQQLLEAETGRTIAIVHDVHNTGELVMGEPLPLVLAATRGNEHADGGARYQAGGGAVALQSCGAPSKAGGGRG